MKKQLDLSNIEAIFTGVEGELLFTEELHYEKWLKFAQDNHVVKNADEFKRFWKNALAGIGDEAIYERMKSIILGRNPHAKFPFQDTCRDQIDRYYYGKLKDIEVSDDIVQAIQAAMDKGIWIVIVSHAPKELLAIQLRHLDSAGVQLHNSPLVDFIFNEKKDQGGYLKALNLVNSGLAGAEKIEPRNVLVLDSSKRYLDRAAELGMQTATIEQPAHYPDYLWQKNPGVKILSWPDLGRAFTKSPCQAPSPRKDLDKK